MRRTKEQAAETRQTILKVAEELFLEKGYENVSLDEIAGAAAVTRGAVHWHFRNKQGLLFAIRDEMRLPMQDLAERLAADTTLAPLTALGDVISSTFSYLQADPRQRRILKVLLQVDWASSEDDPDSGKTFQHQFRGSLIKIFEAAERNEAPARSLDAEICCHSVQRDVERADQRMGLADKPISSSCRMQPQSCERSSMHGSTLARSASTVAS